MVCLNVYSKCTKINYKSTICSKATLFILITKVLAILLPFIFAYNSKGFWLKRDTFHEQPDIKFKHEYVFIAETDLNNSPVSCSNIINFQNENTSYKCSMIKVREIDNNEDGKTDELYFSLTLDSIEIFRIHSILLILPIDYKIHTICPIHMQTLAIIKDFHVKPGIKINFIGDLIIAQNSPIPCDSQNIFRDEISLSDRKYNNFELWDIFEEHFRKNVSTKIDNHYTAWTSGNGYSFSLNIHLRYPEHTIYYKPKFWQVIKFAWVQYIALFILISWFINKIQSYVFTNKLVLYHLDKTNKKLI